MWRVRIEKLSFGLAAIDQRMRDRAEVDVFEFAAGRNAPRQARDRQPALS